MTRFQSTAYGSAQEMIFGKAKLPVTCGMGVVVGGGEVLPEVNFTLPAIPINVDTIAQVQDEYRCMAAAVLERAAHLSAEAIVLEFEHLFELTLNSEWGADITAIIKEQMVEARQKHGLRSALRVTVADIRERERPPLMRQGAQLEAMLESFQACAAAGADILSIESTGGKEVFDKAVVEGDLQGVVFSMGVLACRDMAFLWPKICDVAQRHNIVPGGDADCCHSNTAMQLAHQRYLPKVLAAVIRPMGAVRSLVAYEQGATGPGKDCAYENPVIKAVAGVPISMEGKSSACAHSSPMGNIAASVCDLWSNESVQNVKLLGGFAPEVSTEMLIYDTRLMNTALETCNSEALRELFVASDRFRDPQAMMLDPEVCFGMGQAIVSEVDDYQRTVTAARFGCDAIVGSIASEQMVLDPREQKWLSRIENDLALLPDSAEELRDRIGDRYADAYLPDEYGLE